MTSIEAAMSSLRLQYELGGTVKPRDDFDPEKEAADLRKAMKGLGTDEKAIIKTLSTLSASQRLETAKMFKTLYGKDLVKDLKSELKGNFEEIVCQLILGGSGFDAVNLRAAMKGIGTDEKVLVEIMCTRSNAEIQAISDSFKTEFGRNLEEDFESETSGHFKRILVSMAQANRDESTEVDEEKAKVDAQKLFDAGEGKIGTDESGFNMILARRSFPQLNAIFAEYVKLSGYDISKAIEKEMSGNLEKSMLCVVGCARNVHEYFADALFESMDGIGTDEKTLTRIVVSRSEIDLEDIKAKFLEKYKVTLKKRIEKECSGDYERMLVAIVGN